ncbi:hypothetical protein H0H92_009588, partial [Tricholoma furcatifolium]
MAALRVMLESKGLLTSALLPEGADVVRVGDDDDRFVKHLSEVENIVVLALTP